MTTLWNNNLPPPSVMEIFTHIRRLKISYTQQLNSSIDFFVILRAFFSLLPLLLALLLEVSDFYRWFILVPPSFPLSLAHWPLHVLSTGPGVSGWGKALSSSYFYETPHQEFDFSPLAFSYKTSPQSLYPTPNGTVLRLSNMNQPRDKIVSQVVGEMLQFSSCTKGNKNGFYFISSILTFFRSKKRGRHIYRSS